jgi:hypothetical protein
MKGALQEGCDECPLVVGGEGLDGLEEGLDGGGHGVWVRMSIAGCETSEVLETSEVWVGIGVVVGRAWVKTALRQAQCSRFDSAQCSLVRSWARRCWVRGWSESSAVRFC